MTQKITSRVNLADVVSIDIEGRLWNDVHANTYHSVYVSVLLKGADKYQEIGYNTFSYGYDYEYETTALKIISEAVAGFNPDESKLHYIAKELDIRIDSRKEYVKRKKDL